MIEFTQQELHEVMEELGYKHWTLRQMGTLRRKGYLPKLTPKRKPGTNKALNVWTEADIDHIFTAYSLFEEYGGNYDRVAIALWLKGYDIPIELLRRTFLRPLEKYLHRLTKGETDIDEISLAVSSIAMTFINKLVYTPSLVTQRKKSNLEEMKLFIQILLDIVSDLEPDSEMLQSTFLANDEEGFAISQHITEIVRDILSFPHLREVINSATLKQWQRVREDLLSLGNVFAISEERRIDIGSQPYQEDFLLGLKITGAYLVAAPLLSIRYHGYGHWIDMVFKEACEFLANPEVYERVLALQNARRKTLDAIENS